MEYKFLLTKKAKKELKKIDKKDAKRILKKLLFFSKQKDPISFAKKLNNFEAGEYRFRIGDYRVIFDVDARGKISILMILSVKHRREVYRL